MPVSHKKKRSTLNRGQYALPDPTFRRLIWAVLVFFLCAWGACSGFYHASAQDLSAITVNPPDTTGFPTISVEFKITGTTSDSINALTSDDLTVIENGDAIPVTSLSQEYRGVLFSLVVNAATELDLRDTEGISRYEKLSESLESWVSSRTFTGEDTWSFVTNDGIEVRAASTADEWCLGLDTYQPSFRSLVSDLTGLESAIQAADERVVALGVDKVLLYITPPPSADQIDAVGLLAEDASAAGIQVNVWMVGDELYLANDQGGALMNLASLTGGQFFHYTGVETIPDLDEYLTSLGYVSILTYESGVRATGTYPLQLEVSLPNLQLSGESQDFYIDVQPPHPIFISPPAEITIERTTEKKSEVVTQTPEYYEWQIMVEFPDGYDREIVASRLYVDGRIVDVNGEASFDSFTWDFANLTESGEYAIQVEVEDSLGLSSRTILIPVQVELIESETKTRLTLQQAALIFAAFVLAAAFVVFMIWLVRRLLGEQGFEDLKSRLFGQRKGAEVDQAMSIVDDRPVLAVLVPLNGMGDGSEDQPILITQSEFTIGLDEGRVDWVIDDAGVSGVHARLRVHNDGFWLQDLGSTTGTWVNYTEIGTKNVRIRSGDLIHFGFTGFQFTIEGYQAPADVTVYEYESLL